MKKLLAISVLFLMTLFSTFGQSKGFELYRLSTITLSTLYNDKWYDSTYVQTYLLSIDLDNMVITFDNQRKSTIYIGNKTSETTEKDNEGKTYNKQEFLARDENNIVCVFTFYIYPDSPDRIFKLSYSNLVCILHVKLVKAAIPIPKPDNNINNEDGSIMIG